MIKNILSDVVLVCGGIFTLSVLSLATALTAQYFFGLEPCILCLYQRVPFVLTALLGLAGLIVAARARRVKISALLILLCAPIFVMGAVIAFYHVGVEQHWWASFLEGCAVDLSTAGAGDLLSLIESKPAVRCDEIPWADPFFGISMAGYNVMFSFGMAVFSLLGAIFITRIANGLYIPLQARDL